MFKSTPTRSHSAALLSLIVSFAISLVFATPSWAQSESTLFDFAYGSYATPILDSVGNLYGTSISGGTYHAGTVYKLSPVSGGGWEQTTLYTFTGGTDGNLPYSPLTFDSAGNLYGTTLQGGASKFGVVFKLTPSSSGEWQESVLYSFTGLQDGAYPSRGNLVFDSAGNIYGSNAGGGNQTTQSCSNTLGCGVLFRLSPHAGGAWHFQVLHTFTGGSDGVGPASLTFDSHGVLYGSATGPWGGWESPYGPGLIFKLTQNSNSSWTETPIFAFRDTSDGGLPGTILFDQNGNLYGAAAEGGGSQNCVSGYQATVGCGVVFELSPTSSGPWKETVLYSFIGTTDGFGPGGLVLDNGKLYGIASGGSLGRGIVFQLSSGSNGWSFSGIYAFHGPDGSSPTGLVQDSAGHLFGSTVSGGSHLNGVAFEITP